jgi:hypothetical protein
MKKYTKKKLTKILKGETNMEVKGRLMDIQAAAQNKGIPLAIKKLKVHEGWEGKLKGLLQVLWERGWIDNSDNKAYQNYTIMGRKDEFNIIHPEISLKHLMSSCVDFKEEETMLQSMISSLGIDMDRSPKCHCKIAGEGTEYSWGCAKNCYRNLLLEDKRGKEKFLNSIRLCMSNKVLTHERIQMYANEQGTTSLDTAPFIKQALVMINRTMKTTSKSYQQSSSKWSRRLKLTVVLWILIMDSAKQFSESAIELIL